jgi:hypothetical protein
MRASLVASVIILYAVSAIAQQPNYPRDLFDTARPVTGATPFPDYDPSRLDQLYSKRQEIELQMFDVINEAAVRHDPRLQRLLDLYGKDLGYVPLLAVAHYKWVFGDKSQLDWLLDQDKKAGLGRDSLVLTVFGYMDEWDKTIRRFKENAEYNAKGQGGAGDEVLQNAMDIRKRIYGEKRFEKAWKAVKTK